MNALLVEARILMSSADGRQSTLLSVQLGDSPMRQASDAGWFASRNGAVILARKWVMVDVGGCEAQSWIIKNCPTRSNLVNRQN